jgi:hypothetical protein
LLGPKGFSSSTFFFFLLRTFSFGFFLSFPFSFPLGEEKRRWGLLKGGSAIWGRKLGTGKEEEGFLGQNPDG